MTTEKKGDKMLYLACLAQANIDALDEEIGEFRFKHKRVAKQFLEEQLKLMDRDFGDAKAVDQLVELSQWIHDVFKVMLDIGKREREEQKAFQEEWENLLIKYNL